MGNIRRTKQSQLILDIINNSKNHLNAYEVYEEARKVIDNISLGTVYRNLQSLVESGSILKLRGEDEVDHYDNTLKKHHHFICTKCQKIIDIWDRINISTNVTCGKVMNYEIYYRGICNNCLEKEKENGTKRK